VLSIQSHTVTGYCGNRCAVFPLQLLGLEVNAINSVQFSNHGAYPTVKGQRLDGKDLTDLADGLEANGLLWHDYLLTGYIGTASMLETIAALVKRLRGLNSNLQYVCDPVLGDKGRLYLPQELVPLYREVILPLADTITPNAYEAELLSGVAVRSEEDAVKACEALHGLGPSTVVITSLEGGEAGGPVVMMASTRVSQEDGLPQRFKLELPRLDIPDFAGPGDLMTALLLGWSHRKPGRLQEAVVAAAASLQAVLQATTAAAGPTAFQTDRSSEVLKQRELRLVSCQDSIRKPPVSDFNAKPEALP